MPVADSRRVIDFEMAVMHPAYRAEGLQEALEDRTSPLGTLGSTGLVWCALPGQPGNQPRRYAEAIVHPLRIAFPLLSVT